MNKYDIILFGSLIGVLVLTCTLLFIDAQLTDARYYDCVYNVKGLSVSPADIQVICGR